MKKILFLVGVSSCLLTGQALATSGNATLSSSGNLVASSCDFELQDTVGSPISSVSLPDISESTVFNLSNNGLAADDFGSPFQLAFSNCANTESIRITYSEDAQTGTAVGINLVLVDASVKQDPSSIPNLFIGGASTGVKPFSINYERNVANNEDVIVGSAAKVFNFVVTYL